MVAINKILLPERNGEGCGGDTDVCTDSRVHGRSAESRAPATRNHRSAPILGRWLIRDPIGYQGGINLYGYVNSSPVGNVDAEGKAVYYGVVNPHGRAFGFFRDSGGHALVVLNDPAEPSGYAVASWQGRGWRIYDWSQYCGLPGNRHVQIELWKLPGADTSAAWREIDREMANDPHLYGVAGRICSTQADKVGIAALVAAAADSLYNNAVAASESDITGTGHDRLDPNALPKVLRTLGDIPKGTVYPAPAGPAKPGGFFGWLRRIF